MSRAMSGRTSTTKSPAMPPPTALRKPLPTNFKRARGDFIVEFREQERPRRVLRVFSIIVPPRSVCKAGCPRRTTDLAFSGARRSGERVRYTPVGRASESAHLSCEEGLAGVVKDAVFPAAGWA